MQIQSGKRGVPYSLALAVVLLGMLTAGVHAADPTPCEPCRWTNDPWSADTSYEVTLYEQYCKATIFYKTRKCLHDGCNEVQIDRILFSDSCNMSSVEEFSAFTRLGNVFYDFVNNNPMSFPPNNAGESSCWRFVTPRCWRTATIPCTGDGGYGNPSHNLIACSETDCCVSQVVVVKDGCSELHFHEYPLDEDYSGLTGFSDMYDPDKDCEECTPLIGGGPSIECANYCVKLIFEGLVKLYSN